MSNIFGDESMRRCSRCRETKVTDEFYRRKATAKVRAYWSHICKACAIEAASQNYVRPEVTARIKARRFQRQYGISRKTYDAMFAAQGGLCAICHQPETMIVPRTGLIRLLSVDHNHVTGAVRSLLCSNCNRALGWFKDDIRLLRSATKYLERHSS